MRDVYAYYDLADLPNSPYYESIKGIPQITSSYELGYNLRDSFGMKPTPVSFSSLMSKIAPLWKNEIDEMNKLALASEFFRSEIARCPEDLRDWLRNCKRNSFEMISAIETLTECRYSPDDLSTDEPEIALLRKLWTYLSDNTDSFLNFDACLKSLDSREKLDSILLSAFGLHGIDTVILHGFYYLTPLQEYVFDAFERNGIRLIMLIHYDSNYSFANEIWEKTFADKSKYPERSDWEYHHGNKDNCIGNIFENRGAVWKEGHELREYDSLMDFVRDIELSRKNGFELYSPDYRTSNNLLRDFFSNEYEYRKLSSYPLGQFLLSLYSMWDEDEESLRLDVDLICRCFSTGWLSYSGVDSKGYVDDLIRMSFYFEDCETIDEWYSRLDYLDKIDSDVISHFRTRDGVPKERWDSAMSNPFNNIGVFALDQSRIVTVLTLIRRLLDFALDVFSNEEVTLDQHFGVLDKTLRNHADLDYLNREYAVVSVILGRVESVRNTRLYRPYDLKDAVMRFITDGFDEFDDEESETELVKAFRKVDSACISKSKGCHILLCDIERLPGKSKQLPWPLNRSVMEGLAVNAEPVQKRLTEVLLYYTDCLPLSNRYLFFTVLNCSCVIISWLKNMDGKLLQPSPYIEMIRRECGVSVTMPSKFIPDSELIDGIDPKIQTDVFDITRIRDIPIEAKMEYSLCPLKYLYGFILSPFPSYSSDFHIQFVLKSMIGAFTDVSSNNKEYVAGQVLDLFPCLTNIEKRQILDYSRSGNKITTTDFNQIRYVDARLDVLYPVRELRETAGIEFGKLYTPMGRKGLNLSEPTDIKGICTFCQHQGYCRQIVYPVDQEDYYG